MELELNFTATIELVAIMEMIWLSTKLQDKIWDGKHGIMDEVIRPYWLVIETEAVGVPG